MSDDPTIHKLEIITAFVTGLPFSACFLTGVLHLALRRARVRHRVMVGKVHDLAYTEYDHFWISVTIHYGDYKREIIIDYKLRELFLQHYPYQANLPNGVFYYTNVVFFYEGIRVHVPFAFCERDEQNMERYLTQQAQTLNNWNGLYTDNLKTKRWVL